MSKHFYIKNILSLLFLSIFLCTLPAQESLNVSVYAQFDRGDVRYSGSWFYVGTDGTEYALLGAKTGTAIYQIMDAGALEELAFIPGAVTNWREITVIGHHAYVITDASGTGHGLQVIRLDELPLQATLVTTYTETFTKGHIIQKDIFSDAPYVYIPGTSATGGVHIMDISTPSNPVEVGLYNPVYYIHDCFVRGDKLYASAFYEGLIDIVDISDKSNPTLLSQIDIPDGFVHSASITADENHLFVAPEKDGLRARIFNIENIFDPIEVATYTASAESLVHNPYILGDFAFISHNTEGLRIVDIIDPTTPIEVGFYDTWDGESGGSHGLWSACPYLPSGKILGGDREDGLYVWEFNETKAGRIYGTVIDSVTNLPISNATITLIENDYLVFSAAGGDFRTGAVPGEYSLLVSADNYFDKTISVTISEESTEDVLIKLVSSITATHSPNGLNKITTVPNPFHNKLTINNLNKVKNIRFYNILGIEIYQTTLSKNVSNVSIDTKNWESGLYFMNTYDKKGRLLQHLTLVKK